VGLVRGCLSVRDLEGLMGAVVLVSWGARTRLEHENQVSQCKSASEGYQMRCCHAYLK